MRSVGLLVLPPGWAKPYGFVNYNRTYLCVVGANCTFQVGTQPFYTQHDVSKAHFEQKIPCMACCLYWDKSPSDQKARLGGVWKFSSLSKAIIGGELELDLIVHFRENLSYNAIFSNQRELICSVSRSIWALRRCKKKKIFLERPHVLFLLIRFCSSHVATWITILDVLELEYVFTVWSFKCSQNQIGTMFAEQSFPTILVITLFALFNVFELF